MGVSRMCAVRSRCASLLSVELVLRALGDGIVVRRVWRGHTPRWMGHDGYERRDESGPRAVNGEEKFARAKPVYKHGALGATWGWVA
ncbi:hypothetical protein EDB83DRAFT_987651 [Lactarius deliciosus]|nr:hypothetical protein EDB83DRAFT_987651 [Lactarius deliciosus]